MTDVSEQRVMPLADKRLPFYRLSSEVLLVQ